MQQQQQQQQQQPPPPPPPQDKEMMDASGGQLPAWIGHNEMPPPPPPPVFSSAGIVATDITQEFASAVRALKPGELIKDPHFTLFESVGALEIMDPKMDSGHLAPGESLDEEYDVTRPLLPVEVIGIIDQLLCLEMAWHQGYPLSQTLLTSVYVEAILVPEPKTLEQAHFIRTDPGASCKDALHNILRAYCVGLLHTCWHVNECIKNELYQEEEDFVTNTYNRSLLGDMDMYDVREILVAARKMGRDLRDSISIDLVRALDCRLELRTAMLRALELAELRANPESLKLPWKQATYVWENVNQSHGLGKPVPEAFSTKLQRRLASTLPPRPIVQLSFEETYINFRGLLEDAIEVNNVLRYTDSQSLLNFILGFHAKKPQPLVFVRCLGQSLLFKDMMVLGQFSVRDIIDDDLSILLLPCSPLLDRRNDDVEHPNDPRCALAQQMEQFRQRVAGSYLDLLRSLCQNRCRLRRILCHSIKEWEMLYLELDSIDGLLQLQLDEEPLPPTAIPGFLAEDGLQYSMPLQSWAYSYKLRLMEWVVQLGFELELYLPDELASMYWWLSYLAQCRFRFTSKNRAMISHSRDETRAAQQGQVHHTVEAQYTRALSHNRLSTLDACLVRDLAEAVSLVFVVLARLQLVRAPARPYGGDDLRYAVRMRPWTTVGLPEVPAAAELAALTDRPAVATPDLLRRAEQALAGARETLEALGRMGEREAFHAAGGYARWRAGVLDCQRSAIAAGLAVSMLRKHADDAGALRVEMPRPEGRYHEWWIVPKVTEKKAEETEA